MWEGRLAAIYLSGEAAAPMRSVDEVRVVPGSGLEGDRYAASVGTWSERPGEGREVTLIESEAIAAIAREYDIEIAPRDARRNLLTEGVPLNHLVEREFDIGEVRLAGIRLCEPCRHLSRLAGAELHTALRHRGGLRATVVRGGTVRPGNPVSPVG